MTLSSEDAGEWDPIRRILATYRDDTTVALSVGLLYQPNRDPIVALRTPDAGRLILLRDQRPIELSMGLQDAVLATVQRP